MQLFSRRPLPKLARTAVAQRYQRSITNSATPLKQRRTTAPERSMMATPTKIHLTPADTGIVKFQPQSEETARLTSQLLQKNHNDFHIFYHHGFHNHVAHHLLSLYGLGAPAYVIEKQFNRNISYMKPALPVDNDVVHDMSDPQKFSKYLGAGIGEHYHDLLVFFQNELEIKGVENVLQEYIFAGDARADDLLVRLFSGFLHPIIHLGFGLEFKQPAIVAEALAQTAAHSNWIAPFFIEAEKAARSKGSSTKTLPELLEEIARDTKLANAAQWEDDNKIRDGILVRAPEEAIHYASQWTVSESDLEIKTAEMINTAIYYTAAAQHPPKQVKFDFYFMHCVNASIFWTTFNALPWLSTKNKVRLLEWKGRSDLVMYASRHCPPLLLEEITAYVPKGTEAGDRNWQGVFKRLFIHEDDGHAIKLGRAVAHGEAACARYEKADWCKIKAPMWLTIGNMVIDSVEDEGAHWAQSVGFEEAWKEYKDRPRGAHI